MVKLKKIFFIFVMIGAVIFLMRALPVESQTSDDYYIKGNTLLISGDYDNAINMYDRSISLNPKSYDAYMGLGMAYKAKGLYGEAYKATASAISIKPDYYQAYYNLGLILEKLNKPNAAIRAYEKFLKEVPGADRFTDVKQRLSSLKKL